tara:strand:+ start:1907 stop:3358 length:1452 start_codon:yes stop_codon:yes gene_type:complete
MKKINKDLVSIIIPFYNEENYIKNAIYSVFNQTYSNYELIIVNDGSQKKFKTTLSNLSKLIPGKIKIIHHRNNQGVSAARNTGMAQASGKYIAFLDADDEWLPDKLEHQLNLMKKNKLDFIHGSYYLKNEGEFVLGLMIAENQHYRTLLSSCDIGLSTVMISSSIAKKIKFPNITTKEDYAFWLKLAKLLPTLSGNKKAVTIYRVKKKSLSQNLIRKFKNAFFVYNKYEKKKILISIFYTIRLSINWLLKNYKITHKNIYPLNIFYIKEMKSLSFDKSFVLVALNLASLGYIKLLYLNLSKIIFWMDGYACKFVIKNFKKNPGRNVINQINLPNNINKIYLCGNSSIKQSNYLKNVFSKNIEFKKIPFLNLAKDIVNLKIDFKDNSIIFINISTPKQEILAQSILKNNFNKKLFIICIGGGLSMASGEEKPVPLAMEKFNLEWLWRLRINTLFRLKRLMFSLASFLVKKNTYYFRKFKFIKLG